MSEQIPPPECVDSLGDAPAVSPGEQLRRARDAKGLSIEYLSTRLNIARRHLVALEADDYKSLPGVAFARGYLRNLARELGLNGDNLIESYNQWVGIESPRPVTTVSSVRAQADASHPLMRIFGWVLAVLLVGASLWWWKTQMAPPAISEPVASLVPSAAVVQTSMPAAAGVRSDDLSLREERAGSAEHIPNRERVPEDGGVAASDAEPVYLTEAEIAKLAAQLEQDEHAQAASEPDSSADSSDSLAANENQAQVFSAEQPVQGAILSVSFSDDCWVTLKDASGKTRVARIYKAGERLELNVAAPAELLLGRASAVDEASYAGEVLNIAEVARKNVARLSLQ